LFLKLSYTQRGMRNTGLSRNAPKHGVVDL
jgi:hypothetical protein